MLFGQPKGLGIGWTASIGAILALMVGVIHWQDIPVVWGIIWNATLAFIAIIIISLLLDEAGFFNYIALYITRLARGRGTRLFVLIVLLGALVSAFFANDGAALILTPIVLAILSVLQFRLHTTIAFIMAAGFIADTASLPLLVSNLVNIVAADFFNVSFNHYAKVMIPVNMVSVVASLLVLYFFYRKNIPHGYDDSHLMYPKEAIKDSLTFAVGWGVLIFLLLGFFYIGSFGSAC